MSNTISGRVSGWVKIGMCIECILFVVGISMISYAIYALGTGSYIVSDTDRDYLNKMVKECPELYVESKEALSDGKMYKREFREIRNHYDLIKLKNIIDSTKDENDE